MVEVMAAMAVLAILATAAAAMMVRSLGVTGSDRDRVRAASVAAQEIERVRGLMQTNPAAIVQADASHTVTNLTATAFTVASAPAVGGIVFNLLDSGVWQSASSYNALNMTVTITWPNMAGVKPVINSAVLTVQGANGDGSGGNIVTVASAPPAAIIPTATLSPTCSDRLGTISVTAASAVTAPAGLVSVPWDATTAGTVVAQATGSNPCGTATIPLTYSGGVYAGSLPYGTWVLTAKLADNAVMTENVTTGSLATIASPLVVSDNCGGTSPLNVTVQTKNLLSGLLTTLLGANVTATRTATSTCSVPVTTSFSTIAGGLLSGNIAYGNWGFAATTSSGPVSGSASIASGSGTTLTLTANDTSCPTVSAPTALTVNTAYTVLGITTPVAVASGNVTATRTASGGCAAATVPMTVTAGSASGNLGYGTWTFSLDGASPASSWPSVNVTSSGNVAATVNALGSCASTTTMISATVQQHVVVNIPLVAGTLRATMTANGPCQPATSVTTLVAAGITALPLQLPPGTWTFSVDGHTYNSSTPASDKIVVTGAGGSSPLTLVVN